MARPLTLYLPRANRINLGSPLSALTLCIVTKALRIPEALMRKAVFNRFAKAGCALSALAALSACGGGSTGASVASTPLPQGSSASPPPAAVVVTPTAPVSYDTAEYQRSNAAVQAKAIGAYQAGATGKGVVVGLIDSGIKTDSAEFAGRIHPASADIVGNRGLMDEGGHGTSVANVLLGARNEAGIQGIAFGATLLMARTDSPGSCAADGCTHIDSNIAKGIDLAVSNGARVINVSLGGTPPNAALKAAVNRATAAGTIIVFSGGNQYDDDPVAGSNPDPLAQIALDPVARNLVIIAGGLDASNTALAAFSNRAGNGASHYLGALAVHVRSIDETGAAMLFSGSSYSAPAIAGAAALLAEAFPNLSGAQIVDLLFKSATDLGAAGVDKEFGHGALDITRAFQPQGQTSLASSAIPVSLTSDGGLSAPMGDATATGLSTTVLDSYGRAFTVDLGQTLGGISRTPYLTQALSPETRGASLNAGRALFSVSLRQSGSGAQVERMLLAPHDKAQSRAMAGSVFSRLSDKTLLAMGFSQSGTALARSLARESASRFVIARDVDSGWGFEYRPSSSILIDHRSGAWRFTAGGESGAARRFDALANAARPREWQRYTARSAMAGADWSGGRLTLSARVSTLIERETVLGAKFAAYLGNPGARSLFLDTGASVDAGHGVTLHGSLRQGRTSVARGGVMSRAGQLRSTAWSLDAVKASVFARQDSVGLRLSQPLRIARGGFALTLPVAYDYASGQTSFAERSISLAPKGRERDVEAYWSMPLAAGAVTANLFYRKDPDHIRALQDDAGAAIRVSWGF